MPQVITGGGRGLRGPIRARPSRTSSGVRLPAGKPTDARIVTAKRIVKNPVGPISRY